MFSHERFEAYQIAIKFFELALQLIEALPAGNATVKDQFKRVAMSVPLNIAEGTGKRHKADRYRYYTIARGSALESAAICDVITLLEPRLKNDSESAKKKKLLKSVVAILTHVCSG
jgi:four helix bundle protein